MNQTMIESMQTAWRAALEEFLCINPSGEHSMLDQLLVVIKKVRDEQLLRDAKNELFVRHIYGDIRNIQDFYRAIMSMTATFNLALADIPEAVAFFSRRVEAYTGSSLIIDRATLDRKAPIEALGKILTDNAWLFMLCFASTQESLTVRVIHDMSGKGKPK